MAHGPSRGGEDVQNRKCFEDLWRDCVARTGRGVNDAVLYRIGTFRFALRAPRRLVPWFCVAFRFVFASARVGRWRCVLLLFSFDSET